MLDPKQCVLFSGGAAGTEQFFGAQAEAWGIEEVNFSFEGHQLERKRGVRVLTSDELALKDVSMTYVSRLMGREYTRAPMFRKVLQSICWQVSSGQEVIVVGSIQEDKTVKGGTGWGAEFAKLCNKPLLVFDQERNDWFRWTKEDWAVEKNPVIAHAHFTATGTRFLEAEGRKAIAWYVGRDTAELSEEGVIKAAVETVAENLTDGVVSPLVFMLIGGAPLGMLYKAVNTLDSMVGYHNDKYEYFGKFSAKMDDFFNFIPARLSALCMIAGAGMLHLDNRNALRIYRRDRNKHKSPNAGQTESACAGALHIQLGGDASYFGKIVKKAAFGDPIRRVDRTDILATVDLMTAASVLALVLCCTIRLIVRR